MNREDLIGRKVLGFKFDSNKYSRVNYEDTMDRFIDKEGVIVEAGFDSYAVNFGGTDIWSYPNKEVEKYLIEEEYPHQNDYETVDKSAGKRVFETGSKRDADDNKPIPMELNPYMLLRYGYHMKSAQQHYGDGNWELGQPDVELWRSFSRHFMQAYFNFKFPELGKQTDDGSDHLSACIFAINMLMHNEANNGVAVDKFFKDKKTLEVHNKNGENTNIPVEAVKGKYITLDLGNFLYNPDIWSDPFPKPIEKYLGISFSYINSENIPYSGEGLLKGDYIENEDGERLTYIGGGQYRLVTDKSEAWLANWFSNWRKVQW